MPTSQRVWYRLLQKRLHPLSVQTTERQKIKTSPEVINASRSQSGMKREDRIITHTRQVSRFISGPKYVCRDQTSRVCNSNFGDRDFSRYDFIQYSSAFSHPWYQRLLHAATLGVCYSHTFAISILDNVAAINATRLPSGNKYRWCKCLAVFSVPVYLEKRWNAYSCCQEEASEVGCALVMNNINGTENEKANEPN